jgi:hypothetical protein
MSNEPNTELPIYWPKHWPERWKPRSSDNCKTCGMMLSDKDKLRYDEVYNKWTDSPPTWLGTDDPGKHIDNDCGNRSAEKERMYTVFSAELWHVIIN